MVLDGMPPSHCFNHSKYNSNNLISEIKILDGITNLLEKRLKILGNVTKSGKENIDKEVDFCLDAERIAKQEGIEYIPYVEKRRQLINDYNKKKSGINTRNKK
jgi:hypothetical protein